MIDPVPDNGCMGGDYDAFFRATFPYLVSRGVLLGWCRHDAEEWAQDALVGVLRVWETMCRQRDANPRGYAYRAMVNAARSAERSRAIGRKYAPRLWNPPSASGVEETESTNRLAAAARTRLTALPPQQRTVLVLVWDGWTPREIGQLLGLAPSGVRSHLNQARHKLAEHLDRQEGGLS
jgi:RNA polymerase sigma factor (sigma-70 family)